MKKLSILRQKLIQETKQLIDEDVIDIRSVDHDFQSVTDSQSKKENLQTVQSDFSSKQNQVENGDSQISARQKLLKNQMSGQYGNQFKKREGEDNLLSLQKTNLRKHKADIKVAQTQIKNQSQSQLNFHNTLLDIQKEYLDYEMKKAQNEYAIDLDLIQEDFANQQQKQQPHLDQQKKKKSEFIDLLKKCKICSESDLHYASKPFKLMKKLKDIRIMFERKSNNLEQQMKKSNMNKNKIIEDIKADKVIIRKALPEMAKNYLSEIQQQKRINKLLQEKNIQKAKKQLASINQNQSGFSMLNSNQMNDQNLNLQLQYIDSQDPSVYINPAQEVMQSQTTKNYYKNNSTSPFRKNFSSNYNKEAKTSRNNNNEISQFNDYVQTNDSKSLSRFSHLEQKRRPNQQPKLSGKYNSSDKNGIPIPCIAEYGNYFSQENSPYIRQLDSRQKSSTNKVISSNFNETQKRKANSISIQQQQQNNQNDSSINIETVTIPSSFQNQIASVSTMNPMQSKQSLSSFTTLHLQQNIPEQKRASKVNQIDLNSINSLANLPQTTDRQSHISFQHRHSNSEINNGSQISMEKIQYQIFLSNLKDNQQNSNTDRIQQYLKNQKQIDQFQQSSPQKFSVSSIHNKSLSSLSTTFKTSAPPGGSSSSGAMLTDRQNLRNDQTPAQSPSGVLLYSNLNQAQNNNFDTPSQFQKYSSNTSFAFRSDKKYNPNNNVSQQSRLYAKQNEINKKQKSKEGILENVYKFDEDKYFQHQQIYKYEIEQAQILAIKRNQTTRPATQQQSQKGSENPQSKNKKNEGYFHDEYSSNDDSIPSATEAQLDNFYEESKKIQKKVLKLKKGDLHTKIKSLLRIENINNEINKLVQWKMKK
ncbi:hypothetical protein TTHERM_01248850 (macronuclear) [Tetrahymena thermophila SB210]|uniref:Uncharacterized protein n=1 Tax=Tetrahymena thermophila (strain SB210) TaxID=312017 RepID=Q22AC3_TETTS|nr:hypothetical protein TTHERM_01248850 [Tetrahymena thermophila SB210]EAR82226.1 hypothetical protein TTHERM_01248850 [Tetrahymena thermophila SB210]|eukprot:XP_001029889.1 hypothetical protein TTHERM_01248850 [Tetrahymena thermophila SB210]